MNSGIYCIFNSFDKKYYVGQSIELAYRLSKHKNDLNYGKHYNKKLQKDFNLKRPFFDIYILEEVDGINKNDLIERLNEREKFWIEKLKSHTFGYNQNPGGRNVFGRWSKKFNWINLKTLEKRTASLSEMALLCNSTTSCFARVSRKLGNFSFDWTLEERFDEVFPIWEKTRGRLVSLKNVKTNEVILDMPPALFAKRIGARRSDVYFLVNKKTLSLWGWRLIDKNGNFLKREKRLSNHFLDVENTITKEVIKNINLSTFAEKYSICKSSIYTAIKCNRPYIKEWNILKINRLKSIYDATHL